jgi:hypothetical protein
MGGVVPADTVATGSITIVAGSKTDSGTIRILTRSVDQSAERILTPDTDRTLIYSRGSACEKENGSSRQLPLERAATSQSSFFPLLTLATALQSDWAVQYLGLDTLGDVKAHHIRFWNTLSSNPKFSPLAEFSVRDIWIDAASNLPRKLAYEQREATGPEEPRIRIEVYFSDYRNLNGVLYPFLVQESFNGTPWTTIRIEKVVFNSGLSGADFPVQ